MLRKLLPFLSVFLLAGPVFAVDTPSTSVSPGAKTSKGVHHRHHKHRPHHRKHTHTTASKSR
jgi:hypothetical protein